MSWDFSFSIRMEIVQDQFPITLYVAGREIEARAYLDTSGAYSAGYTSSAPYSLIYNLPS